MHTKWFCVAKFGARLRSLVCCCWFIWHHLGIILQNCIFIVDKRFQMLTLPIQIRLTQRVPINHSHTERSMVYFALLFKFNFSSSFESWYECVSVLRQQYAHAHVRRKTATGGKRSQAHERRKSFSVWYKILCSFSAHCLIRWLWIEFNCITWATAIRQLQSTYICNI